MKKSAKGKHTRGIQKSKEEDEGRKMQERKRYAEGGVKTRKGTKGSSANF